MIIEKLRATSSSLEKQRILKSATPAELLMFRCAYDKNLVYGLKWATIEPLQEPCQKDFDLLDKLATRRITGNAARVLVTVHCEVHGGLVKLMCNKDLDCGVTATLVNKVHPGTVPVFKCQLAKEIPLTKVEFPCYAEIKYDGVRLLVINERGIITFKTRNGKVVNLPKLKQKLEACCLSDYVLDTEVTLANGTMVDRTKVSGMINSAMKGGVIAEDKLQLNVFDHLAIDEFNSATCHRLYFDRRQRAVDTLAALGCDQLVPAKAVNCKNATEANSLFEEVLAEGMEGLILKHINSKYLFKRSAEWVKMKAIKSADLRCIAVLEGTGKYEGLIGALRCKGKVEGKQVVVNVGSGLTDLDRELNDYVYLGETIEIRYNAVIQSSVTKEWSLFLPRFVVIRPDK